MHLILSRIEDFLHNIPNLNVYVDDMRDFSDKWDAHLALLNDTLTKLEVNGFKTNPLKLKWGTKESDWLSYCFMLHGLKLQKQ